MKTVHKYIIRNTKTIVGVPVGAILLTVKEQGKDICVWVEVDTDVKDREYLEILLYGTGHEIRPNANLTYINTLLTNNDRIVIHAYENNNRAKI